MHKHLLTAIAALAISPSISFAADAPAELASLDFFVGNWNCSGITYANPMGPQHETTGTVHASKAVGERWIQINYDENKTKANATPYHVGVYMGFDAGAKKFVQGCVDNSGGYCTQSSSGWKGDVITFEGTANGRGQTIGVRDTFIRKGTKELVHAGEIQGADKQWAQTDKETCKRR